MADSQIALTRFPLSWREHTSAGRRDADKKSAGTLCENTLSQISAHFFLSLRQFDHVSFCVFQSPSASSRAFTASSRLRGPPSHDVHLSAVLLARGFSVLSTTSWNSTCLCQACSVLSTVFFIVDSRHHVPLCSRISSCLLGISLGRVFTIFAHAKQKCPCLPSRSGPSSAPTILGFFWRTIPASLWSRRREVQRSLRQVCHALQRS